MSEEVARVPREDTATITAVAKDLSNSHPSPTETASPVTAGTFSRCSAGKAMTGGS